MELRVFNANLEFIGLLENQHSVIWKRRYGRVGSFEVRAPITPYNIFLFEHGNIMWVRGKKEAGVIEDLKLRHSPHENTVTVSGRFLESYMDRRLIRPRINFSGTVENAMRTILTNAVPIPLVQLEDAQGLTETITFQATYKNLLSYMEKLARSVNYGFRFRPNFTEKTITFEIFIGKDRSIHQTDRPHVVFSESYNNINEVSMNVCDQLYKNIAYVGGQGEGLNRKIVVVGNDSSAGLERRETFVNAADISADELSESAYEDKLRQRGNDVLNEDVIAESLEFITEVKGNFRYREHYDLGDVVTAKKESWTVSRDMRITEVMEVYEYSEERVVLTLGESLPEKINWEDM